MSRVDRYKHIHEKSRPAEHKKTFNPRKSMGEHREEEPEELAESLQETVYEDSYTEDSRRSESDIKQIQVVATVLTNHPRKKTRNQKRKNQNKTLFQMAGNPIDSVICL